MKVCVYGIENQGVLSCFADGLKNIGVHVVWRRHDVFTEDQVEKFDAVVVNGLRKHYLRIRDAYIAKGIPVMVVDLGHIRNTPMKYYQVGFNNLGWLPEFDCPRDRLEELGITYPGSQSDHEGGHILIFGQMPDDAAHGMNRAALNEHYVKQIEMLRLFYPKHEIRYRKHPNDHEPIDSRINCTIDRSKTLKEALEGCYFAGSLNSTAGLEAILLGYTTVAEKPCVYKELTCSEGGYFYPDETRFTEVLSRITYAQWTLGEINEGLPQKFLINALHGIKPEFVKTDPKKPENKIEPEITEIQPEISEVIKKPRRGRSSTVRASL